MARDMGEGEPWLLLAMSGHTSIYPLLIVNLLIYSIKMICTNGEDIQPSAREKLLPQRLTWWVRTLSLL